MNAVERLVKIMNSCVRDETLRVEQVPSVFPRYTKSNFKKELTERSKVPSWKGGSVGSNHILSTTKDYYYDIRYILSSIYVF